MNLRRYRFFSSFLIFLRLSKRIQYVLQWLAPTRGIRGLLDIPPSPVNQSLFCLSFCDLSVILTLDFFASSIHDCSERCLGSQVIALVSGWPGLFTSCQPHSFGGAWYTNSMSHTVSLELSKKLYRLSRWEYTTHQWLSPVENSHPVYDLGYLLRKLPPQVVLKKEYEVSSELPEETPAYYRAMYDTADGQHYWLGAATPEDALAHLAVALFTSGILR